MWPEGDLWINWPEGHGNMPIWHGLVCVHGSKGYRSIEKKAISLSHMRIVSGPMHGELATSQQVTVIPLGTDKAEENCASIHMLLELD